MSGSSEATTDTPLESDQVQCLFFSFHYDASSQPPIDIQSALTE
jgi:hypothetical protein